jgi:hypothetical protein
LIRIVLISTTLVLIPSAPRTALASAARTTFLEKLM